MPRSSSFAVPVRRIGEAPRSSLAPCRDEDFPGLVPTFREAAKFPVLVERRARSAAALRQMIQSNTRTVPFVAESARRHRAVIQPGPPGKGRGCFQLSFVIAIFEVDMIRGAWIIPLQVGSGVFPVGPRGLLGRSTLAARHEAHMELKNLGQTAASALIHTDIPLEREHWTMFRNKISGIAAAATLGLAAMLGSTAAHAVKVCDRRAHGQGRH